MKEAALLCGNWVRLARLAFFSRQECVSDMVGSKIHTRIYTVCCTYTI